MPAFVIVVVIAAPALSGCQGQVTEGPEEQAKATARAFLADCARGEIVGAMGLLTESVQAEFVKADSRLVGCLRAAGLRAPGGALPRDEIKRRLDETRVLAVSDIYGEQFATVTVEGRDGTRHDLELDQRGPRWRIASMPEPRA
jgi:hypothetical protein